MPPFLTSLQVSWLMHTLTSHLLPLIREEKEHTVPKILLLTPLGRKSLILLPGQLCPPLEPCTQPHTTASVLPTGHSWQPAPSCWHPQLSFCSCPYCPPKLVGWVTFISILVRWMYLKAHFRMSTFQCLKLSHTHAYVHKHKCTPAHAHKASLCRSSQHSFPLTSFCLMSFS